MLEHINRAGRGSLMPLRLLVAKVGLLTAFVAAAEAVAGTRPIPAPLASHPGNVFVAGEEVVVPMPPGEGTRWRLADYEGNTVKEGQGRNGRAELGRLAVGYYELARGAGCASNRVSVGVVEKLRAPTPRTSPIGIDVAMAWFYTREKMSSVANLCALAGLNRVRDRLNWAEVEPTRGTFAASGRYDGSADAQSAAGLQILQVNHVSPGWANPDGKRFPLDLRDAYNFYRAMAQRWRGKVAAFEPWNEADIPMFGGHTGSEMASLQKAAYLGLKAGNSDATACLNVFAVHRPSTLRDFHDNEAWPYFEKFNLHHYEPFAAYPKLYADFRAVSAGKPLWVTECSVTVKWQGDQRLKEPAPQDLRVQSERVAKVYALAIHEGAQAVFYFMLPHYVEGETQFGLLRPDLTPRPGFVALAATGRLLADAKPIGRVRTGNDSAHGYLFRAKPDGRLSNVLVMWSEHETNFTLPRPPKACFDHLGRNCEIAGKALRLSAAPLYAILAERTPLPLIPPPEPAKQLRGKPSPLVLQAVLPEDRIVLKQSAYKVALGQTTTVPIFLYNFGPKPARGGLRASVHLDPSGPAADAAWSAELPAAVEVAPGGREELPLRLSCPATHSSNRVTVRIDGDFGGAGKPVLSVGLVTD